MARLPSIPYGSTAQVLRGRGADGVWESLTMSAKTKCPSGDRTRGWAVRTNEGNLRKFVDDQQGVSSDHGHGRAGEKVYRRPNPPWGTQS